MNQEYRKAKLKVKKTTIVTMGYTPSQHKVYDDVVDLT